MKIWLHSIGSRRSCSRTDVRSPSRFSNHRLQDSDETTLQLAAWCEAAPSGMRSTRTLLTPGGDHPLRGPALLVEHLHLACGLDWRAIGLSGCAHYPRRFLDGLGDRHRAAGFDGARPSPTSRLAEKNGSTTFSIRSEIPLVWVPG